MLFSNSINLLNNVIQKDPGFIVGPISAILGFVLNIVFNFVYMFTVHHSLGLSIILLTIIVRVCMLPLAFKQQKSMFVMQKIQPEIQKIQNKYKDKASDPEIQKKMNMEMQKLYSKHNYNPFSGCLPMIVQLPIFISLYYVMQNPYQFISVIEDIYNQLGELIMQFDGYIDLIKPYAFEMVPDSLRPFDIADIHNLQKLMNKFSVDEWNTIKAAVPSISGLLEQKASIEYFLGMNLTEKVGYTFPKVLIPIFSGLTTYLSSWLITRRSGTTDSAMKTQQNIMNITMPLFMAFITTGLPGGVGLYWITSNVFQIVQQIILNKVYGDRAKKEEGSTK